MLSFKGDVEVQGNTMWDVSRPATGVNSSNTCQTQQILNRVVFTRRADCDCWWRTLLWLQLMAAVSSPFSTCYIDMVMVIAASSSFNSPACYASVYQHVSRDM